MEVDALRPVSHKRNHPNLFFPRSIIVVEDVYLLHLHE